MPRTSSTPTCRAHPGAEPGIEVGERSGAVEDRDVRRDALGDLLAAVGVDAEVAGERGRRSRAAGRRRAATRQQRRTRGSHQRLRGRGLPGGRRAAVVCGAAHRHVHDDRGVVGGAGAGALVAVDEGAGDPLGQRGRAEHEVDAQAAVALEALPVVVPVGVDVRAGRVRPDHVDVPVVEEGLERRALGRRDVGASSRTAPCRRRRRPAGRCSSRRPARCRSSSQPAAASRSRASQSSL